MSDASSRKSQIRCLNCFERHFPEYGSTQYRCEKCGMEWRLTWTSKTNVKVRGPVWARVKAMAEGSLGSD
jgi:hypothetical protein